MRPVLQSDVAAVARALLAVPHDVRKELSALIVCQAKWADKYTRRFAKPHPFWGDGTLGAAARRFAMSPEPVSHDAEFLECMKLVLSAFTIREPYHNDS